MQNSLAFKALIVGIIALALGAGAAVGGKALLRGLLATELRAHGIGVAGGPAWPPAGLGFQEVKLDNDGDESIGVIAAAPDWSGLLSGQPFAQVALSHVSLIGTVDALQRTISFPGIQPQRLFPFTTVQDLLLDDGQLALDTPWGALQFAMKGRATRQAGGAEQIDGTVQGAQLQMTADTHWSVNILPDGRWAAVADVRDARFAISPLAGARINGWVALKGNGPGQPAGLQGQLSAGMLRLGTQTSLGDLTATLSGTLGAEQVALRGAVNAFPGMVADVQYFGGAAPSLHATVTANSVDQLLAFMGSAQTDLALTGFHPPPGIATPGNLAHVAAAARKIVYASAFLTFDGGAGQLNEKLTLRQATPSGPQDTVISLDPGK